VQILNRTIQNKSKQSRLNSHHVIPSHHVDGQEVVAFLESLGNFNLSKQHLLYSIGVALLPNCNNDAVKKFLDEYDYDPISIESVPLESFDLLGSAYQYLNSKTENLQKGSFYTGKAIAREMVGDLDFTACQTILDPACGSGSFLFHSQASPSQLFGVDVDPIAVMIAKFNYFLKFPAAPPPKIFCEDFFSWNSKNSELSFNYVIGNPPYGANLDQSLVPSFHIFSGESFSYFVELGFNLLKPEGLLRYLVPEALLNVRKHKDVRQYILNYTNLVRIKHFPEKFSGVMSEVYMIELDQHSSLNVIFDPEGSIPSPSESSLLKAECPRC
jgi:type I restriction-modification system DNA methylase subunit